MTDTQHQGGVRQPTATAVPSAELLALARELAVISADAANPTPDLGDAALDMAEKELLASPSTRAMDAQYPGLARTLSVAILAEATRQTDASVPMLVDALQQLYSKNMTATELRQALAFYKTPAAKRLVADQGNPENLMAVFGNTMKSGEVKSDDLQSAVTSTAMKSLSAMDAEERKSLFNFAFSPAGAKMRKLQPQVIAITTEWANAETPEEAAAMQDIITKTMADHIAKSETKTGGKAK
jgi:hypothetical protein